MKVFVFFMWLHVLVVRGSAQLKTVCCSHDVHLPPGIRNYHLEVEASMTQRPRGDPVELGSYKLEQ